MDKQLEEKIRQRAYELWMQHGCLPDRSEEYWYQAEQEILGSSEAPSTSDVGGGTVSEAGSTPLVGSEEQSTGVAEEEGLAPLDTSPAPLGMTSQTVDEVLPGGSGDLLSPPAATKTRRKRSPASTEPTEGGDAAGGAPKRRRTVRTP
jgi:hypothetical protein